MERIPVDEKLLRNAFDWLQGGEIITGLRDKR